MSIDPAGSALEAPTSRRNVAAISTSLGILAAIGIGAFAMAAKAVVVPTLLALLLALGLAPVAGFLERLKIPASLAAAVAVLAAATGIAVVGVVAVPLIGDLMRDAPDIVESLDRKLRPLKESIGSVGKNVGEAADTIETMVAPDGEQKIQSVKIVGDSATQTALRIIPSTLAQFFYAILLAGFVLAGRRSYRLKFIAAARTIPARLRTARIIRDIGDKVAGYLFVLSAINLFDGVAVAVAFALLGLPDPILWGAIFGIGNFAPVVGPTMVMIAAALVGLATQDSLLLAFAGPLAMLAVNIVEGNILQPLLVARRTVVNPVAIFLSFALFAWMWGPAATLLAVPIIVCFAVVARHTPGLRPLAVVLTNEEPQRGRLAELIRAARARRIDGTLRPATGFRGRPRRSRDGVLVEQYMKQLEEAVGPVDRG